jgi:signal transduction histidine kinase
VLRLSPEAIEGWFDDRLLHHALGNLLSNAIKYSPQGGDVVVEVVASGEAVQITVQDSGIGIPEAELPHLFTSFHRASNVGDIKGTGLGLAIVKTAVALHGGTLSVRSEVLRGTCFSLQLPWHTQIQPPDVQKREAAP